jgi:hypothetical protein
MLIKRFEILNSFISTKLILLFNLIQFLKILIFFNMMRITYNILKSESSRAIMIIFGYALGENLCVL